MFILHRSFDNCLCDILQAQVIMMYNALSNCCLIYSEMDQLRIIIIANQWSLVCTSIVGGYNSWFQTRKGW